MSRPHVSCFRCPSEGSEGGGITASMLGATAGTFFVIGLIVLGVILLGYAVYFFVFKKM